MKPIRPSTALIHAVNGGGPNATVRSTTYDVILQVGENQYEVIPQIKPANQRPFDDDSENIIIPAKVGQPCVVHWAADEMMFIITEGIATEDCTQPLGRTARPTDAPSGVVNPSLDISVGGTSRLRLNQETYLAFLSSLKNGTPFNVNGVFEVSKESRENAMRNIANTVNQPPLPTEPPPSLPPNFNSASTQPPTMGEP